MIWTVISSFEINHKECVKYLFENVQMARPCNIARGVVEALFSDLLSVTGPSFKPVFHAVIGMGSTRKSTPFPKELGRLINYVYANAESMNLACLDRFTTWFALQLSNFDFRWEWGQWAGKSMSLAR